MLERISFVLLQAEAVGCQFDRMIYEPEVGVKPDGRIPANAVCPWGVHPVGGSSGRTMGIIDGIVGCPRRLYVIHPLLA